MNPTRLARVVAGGLLLVMVAALLVLPADVARAESAYTDFTVYFPLYTSMGSYIYPVRYLTAQTTTPIKASLEALFAGIPGSPFISLPKETTVEIISVKDGICTVNFSQQIMQLNVGSGGEAAVLSAIVATLGQHQGVDSVRMLMDGKPMESLAGHVDITSPVSDKDVYNSIFQVMEDAYQHWSGGAVGSLMVLDVINGYDDATFRPDNKVTRAEFIKMLVNGLSLPYVTGETVPFKDLADHWFATQGYAGRALAAGLISAADYGDNLKPDEVIPREEMAALLVTAKAAYLVQHPGVDYQELDPVPSLSDLALATEKYRSAIQESAAIGFLRGFPDGTFRPKEGLTRGESATVITRVLGMAETPDPAFRHLIRTNPLQGAKWDGGDVAALGAASAFEANVNWRISGAGGEILSSYVTATMGMGWGMFGLYLDSSLLEGKYPTELVFFLVSMEDGHEYTRVTLPLVR